MILRWRNKLPKDLVPLFKSLGFKPKGIDIYKEALSHKSNKSGEGNYERLEFLGDAILSAIIADYIYFHYPNEHEGQLSKLRSRAVNRKTLNEIGKNLSLKKYINGDINLLKGESSIPGNCLEAIFGAIYIDLGYKKAYRIILKIMENNIDLSKVLTEDTNYKSQLLEYGQKTNKKVLFESKEIGLHKFEITCTIDSKSVKTTGKNKKKAEQDAAQNLLKQLGLLI